MEAYKILNNKSIQELTHDFKNKWISNDLDSSNKSLKSGFELLDAETGGFQPGTLTFIGGEEGVGKTSFVTSLINKMTFDYNYSVAFFSLKCSVDEVLIRILSQITKISVEKFYSKKINNQELQLLHQKIEILEKSWLYINDFPFLTVADIEKVLKHNPPDFAQCIVIDAFHLLAKSKKDTAGKTLSKHDLVQISFQLKKLAQDWNIAVIVTFEISRSKKKYRYRPSLSNIRKVAPIDSFADLVLLLYRPEYHKIDEWDDEQGSSTGGEAELIIAKNTIGNLDKIRIKYDRKFSSFDNLPI